MADTYKDFTELDRWESDYRVEVIDRGSEVTIVAPHGGRIEPQTAEIAAHIAGDTCNLFSFHGLKSDDNHDLHITSHRFDHPRALEMVRQARRVIAVHGCRGHAPITYLGGLDTELIELIGMELTSRCLDSRPSPAGVGGTHRLNICNRGRYGRGVQLELSRGIRDSETLRSRVVEAVQSALETIKKRERQGSYLSRKC